MDLKTHVSLLQEYLVKEGVLPIYQLIQCGSGTQPTFAYEVKAKGLSVIGKGRSKKEAKQEAAKLLLHQLKCKTIWEEETPLISPHIPSVKSNSIGALQEYCMQNCISCPKYDFVSDEGNDIAHVFVVRCTAASYSAEGRASTKQQAKHLAAKAVLCKLKNLQVEDFDVLPNKIKENKELIVKAFEKTREAFEKSLHDRQDRPDNSLTSVKNLINFSDYIKNKIEARSSVLTIIKKIDEELLESYPDPEDLLNFIMSELGYNFKFDFLHSKNKDYYICNLSVKKMHINCIGAAETQNDAKKKAAINVLKVLLVMSKQ